LFHEKARPSVLSITTHHHVTKALARPSVHITTHHHCVTGHVPPCYQSQLITFGFHERHVPPCYQSQLIIM
jgi:hypothetical protein